MAHICRGKNIVQFGPSFITNLLQKLELLSKKPHGSNRETCPPCGWNDNRCLFAPCIFFYRQHGTTGYLCWNLNLFRVRLPFLYTNWVSQAFNVHNSNMNFKYMLQFTKMARIIIHVSFGACLAPMPGMGSNYNRTVVLTHPHTFRISVFKSP